MLYHLRHHFQSGIVMSATEDANGFYGDIIPASYIYTRYDSRMVKNLVRRQKTASKGGRTAENVFLILEDLTYDKQMLVKDKYLRFIFNNGRHYRITLFLSSQEPLSLVPSMRGQIDYCYAFKQLNWKDKQRLWENYFGVFKDFYVFDEVMDEVTKDFKCLVLDQTGQDTTIEAVVRYWKAVTDLPRFKLGNRNYWAWHLMHFDASRDSDSSDDEGRPARKPKVHVRMV